MTTGQYEIRFYPNSHYEPRRWHRIAPSNGDERTEAMNLGCGALVRTTVKLETWATETDGVASTSTSLVFVDGTVVKRWVVVVRDPFFDEETEEDIDGRICVEVEYAVLPGRFRLGRQPAGPDLIDALSGWQEAIVYPWHHADTEMPTPDEQGIREALAKRQQRKDNPR